MLFLSQSVTACKQYPRIGSGSAIGNVQVHSCIVVLPTPKKLSHDDLSTLRVQTVPGVSGLVRSPCDSLTPDSGAQSMVKSLNLRLNLREFKTKENFYMYHSVF